MNKTVQLKKLGMGDIFKLTNEGKSLGDVIRDKKIGDEIHVCNVLGIARGAGKAVHAQYGESIYLTGMFKMKVDEITFVAPKIFLPNYLVDLIAPEIEQGIEVEFAYKIRAVRNDSQIGYEYFGDSLIEVGDPLEALESRVSETLKLENKTKKK